MDQHCHNNGYVTRSECIRTPNQPVFYFRNPHCLLNTQKSWQRAPPTNTGQEYRQGNRVIVSYTQHLWLQCMANTWGNVLSNNYEAECVFAFPRQQNTVPWRGLGSAVGCVGQTGDPVSAVAWQVKFFRSSTDHLHAQFLNFKSAFEFYCISLKKEE